MNQSVMDFATKYLTEEIIRDANILEVGSMDVNGSVKPLVTRYSPKSYVGTDLQSGKGVDLVISCEKLLDKFSPGSSDIIISTEMLEHVRDWRTSIDVMKTLLKKGGYLLLTTRSPGFHVHGYPNDYWRFTVDDFQKIFFDMEIKSIESDKLAPGVFVFAKKIAEEPCGLEDVKPMAVTSVRPGKKVKINLACGQMILDGYINIDYFPNPGVDVVCDIRELQYENNSVDEVIFFHGPEHFSLDDGCMILRKVFSMLKPGGVLIIEAPDVFKAVKNAPTGEFDVIRGLFGDVAEIRNGKDGYQHKWGWTGSLMQQELASVGFNVSEILDGISHNHQWRDFRVEAQKPDGGLPNGKL